MNRNPGRHEGAGQTKARCLKTTERVAGSEAGASIDEGSIEDHVYAIAVELLNQSRKALDISTLHRACVAKLNVSQALVNIGIFNLLKKKVLVEGSKMTADSVLENPLRFAILEHVSKNPGSRSRDLRRAMGIDNGESTWHLQMLERFGHLRSKRFGKYKSFYPAGLEEDLDEILCVLRQDTAYRVFYDVFTNSNSTAADVAGRLEMDPATVQYHVNKLVPLGLIIQDGDGLSVNTDFWTRIIERSPGFSG